MTAALTCHNLFYECNIFLSLTIVLPVCAPPLGFEGRVSSSRVSSLTEVYSFSSLSSSSSCLVSYANYLLSRSFTSLSLLCLSLLLFLSLLSASVFLLSASVILPIFLFPSLFSTEGVMDVGGWGGEGGEQ